MLTKIVVSFLFMSITSLAVAAGVAGQVKRIYPGMDGIIYFNLKGDSCNAEWVYYTFDGKTEAGKLTYSLLLSSAVSQKSISVVFSGEASQCDPNKNKAVSYIYQNY